MAPQCAECLVSGPCSGLTAELQADQAAPGVVLKDAVILEKELKRALREMKNEHKKAKQQQQP